ncbi:MAG: PEP-utilizing enzyme [Patescibacteria group bacterium]|jgi:pyruvate,water dikinase
MSNIPNIVKDIKKHCLTAQGGVKRNLSLFTYSCVARAYSYNMIDFVNVSYGPIAAYGNKDYWYSLLNMQYLTDSIAKNILEDDKWLDKVRKKSLDNFEKFKENFNRQLKLVESKPIDFLIWVIKNYPDYFASLGLYNGLWRYMEYNNNSQRNMADGSTDKIADERSQVAILYPLVEKYLKSAIKSMLSSLNLPKIDYLLLTREELQDVLENNMVNKELQILIKKRSKGYVYLYKDNIETIIFDKDVLNKVKDYAIPKVKNSDIVYGIAAYGGLVKGKVVLDLKNFASYKEPIYITAMTHPDEVPWLKKCLAIVTDEGGVLSHVAVIAREFKIPALMGTKVATQIFKDGDMVEVDANKGIVKKI